MNRPYDPTAERLAIGILMLFLIGYGWFDLWQGGIAVKGRNGNVSFADGGVGLAIAAGAFLFAALVSLLLARSVRLPRAVGGWRSPHPIRTYANGGTRIAPSTNAIPARGNRMLRASSSDTSAANRNAPAAIASA